MNRSVETRQGLVIFVKNKRRVSAFYQQTLGLDVTASDSSHDLLRGHGYQITVHAIPRKIASTIEIARPPKPREMAVFKPSFVVADLAAVRSAATKTGGYLKPADGAWHFRGHTVL